MSTILVHDADYFTYGRVIPNLECAKYAAWRKKKRDIVVFSPSFEPERYSQSYFRKDYDDGNFDKKILLPGVSYGGHAFSETYTPGDLEMERIEPDFSIYDKYKEYYHNTKHGIEEIKKLLYATHVRLSLDGKTLEPFPFDRLQPYHPSIIVHDYDLGALPSAIDLLDEAVHSRPSGLTYRVGNKFPIQVYDYPTLARWLKLPQVAECFYIQYNGLFTDEQVIDLVQNPHAVLKQLLYNFTYGCENEDLFVEKVLPQIYKQALFLRSLKIKILLNIDTEFFKTRELLNLMKLIDCFYGKARQIQFVRPHKQTLYGYCSSKKLALLEVEPWIKFKVSRQEMRESFQYMRVKNYEVFDMFYSVPNIIAKGGQLVNEWS